MRKNFDTLIRRVREELRAEGADGAGFTDFIVGEGINAALDDLSGIFTVRDVVDFQTTAEVNKYDLSTVVSSEINEVIKATYDGDVIGGRQISDYLEVDAPTEGSVRGWLLWGTNLTLIGEVEADKTVELWVTRAPEKLSSGEDVPETPSYADEAIIAHAISVCYRESRDYDRANYHYGIYLRQKEEIKKRGVPQKQRNRNPRMNDSYSGPFSTSHRFRTSDTNPGGRYD